MGGYIAPEELEDFLDAHGGDGMEFCYVADEDAWYLSSDGWPTDREYDMSDFPIPYGIGMYLTADGGLIGGACVQFSGVVAPESTDSANCPAGGYHLTGNVAPADMTIGDFIPVKDGTVEISFANFFVQLTNTNGETEEVCEENMKGIISEDDMPDFLDAHEGDGMEFCYVAADEAWYLSSDGWPTDREYDMTGYPIKAGRGMYLTADGGLTGGAHLVLPSAIEKR